MPIGPIEQIYPVSIGKTLQRISVEVGRERMRFEDFSDSVRNHIMVLVVFHNPEKFEDSLRISHRPVARTALNLMPLDHAGQVMMPVLRIQPAGKFHGAQTACVEGHPERSKFAFDEAVIKACIVRHEHNTVKESEYRARNF